MKIVLPFPDSRLLPNRKLHWRRKAEATSEARMTAWALATDILHTIDVPRCQKAEARAIDRCTAQVFFCPPDKRKRDLDNLLRAMKPFWDGLVDAGILKDDSLRCLTSITLTLLPPDKTNPRTEIIIEEVR